MRLAGYKSPDANEIKMTLFLARTDNLFMNVRVEAVVDSGYSETICIPTSVAQQLGLATDRSTCKTMQSAGRFNTHDYEYRPTLEVRVVQSYPSVERITTATPVLSRAQMPAWTTDGSSCLIGLVGLELLHMDIASNGKSLVANAIPPIRPAPPHYLDGYDQCAQTHQYQ